MDDENILILGRREAAILYAAGVAGKCGDDLGLVLTEIALGQEKVSGGRIEEEREFGGATFQTFDEPVFIGSAIAQLQGYADAVIVSDLQTWAERLLERFPNEEIELEAEIASLTSVMNAKMSNLILIAEAPAESDLAKPHGTLLQKIIRRIEAECQRVIELNEGQPTACKGELP